VINFRGVSPGVHGKDAMKSVIILAGLVLPLFIAPAWATDYPASSCSYEDVRSAVRKASPGDSVTIPACTQTNWTRKLHIACITLQGTGDALGDGAHTIIGDDAGAKSEVIRVNCSSPDRFRITNIEIVGVGASHYDGMIRVSGTSSPFRIDHMKFTRMRSKGIVLAHDSCSRGVIDHNEFNGSFKIGVEVHHGDCNGGAFGDGPWATASDFSGSLVDYVVIEDNTFNDSFADAGPGAIDMFDGSRVIFRHNTLKDLTGHGTDSSQRRRGQRIAIIHNNTFVPTKANVDSAIIYRGGTGLNYSNTFRKLGPSLYYKNYPIKLQNFRDVDRFRPFGVCAGYGRWDNNDGIVYVSGTATSGSVAGALEDATKDFTTACAGGNCGKGDYSIHNITKGWGSSIASVTATTVANHPSAYRQPRAWSAGDSYEILKAYPCLDQVGRGAGDLLRGRPPKPVGWPDQALEPVYSFNNVNENNSSAKEARAATIHINANRDFFNEVAGFDGSAGVGIGALASAPETCTDYTGWFDDTVSPKKFYQCQSDTWVLYYTEGPYPYCVSNVGPGCGIGDGRPQP